jgi:hypothetical protein
MFIEALFNYRADATLLSDQLDPSALGLRLLALYPEFSHSFIAFHGSRPS